MAELDAAVQARLKEWADLLTAFYEGRDPAQKAWLDQELNRRRAAPHAWRDALLWLTPPRAVDAEGGRLGGVVSGERHAERRHRARAQPARPERQRHPGSDDARAGAHSGLRCVT